MPAGHRSLNDHFRGVFQNNGGFSFYGMGEKHDRGQHENNEGINKEQRGILAFPSEKRRECKIKDILCLSISFSH